MASSIVLTKDGKNRLVHIALRKLLAFLLILNVGNLLSWVHATGCIQGDNCRLPDCFCPTFEHPTLPVLDIPQIVYFGFDDAVQTQVSGYYNKIFTPERKNPNGCPITMTLYVSDKYTQYDLVSSYYKRGMEIGSHSVTHTNIDTAKKLRKEAAEQKENIITQGGVPSSKVLGWRSPNLKTAGDAQPDVLSSLQYSYDISLPYSHDKATPWPFTLDYGYPYPCSIPPCPSPDSKHPGFWEVMVRSFRDPVTGLPCGYVDGCRPQGVDAAVEYLWSNFLATYEGQRAPFGLNMHAAWFFTPEYLTAMEKFVDRLLDLDDVYIVNVQQMLAWMKSPVPLAQAKFFQPWGCSGENLQSSLSMPNAFQQLKFPLAPNEHGTSDPTDAEKHMNMLSENSQNSPPGGRTGGFLSPSEANKQRVISFPGWALNNPNTNGMPTRYVTDRQTTPESTIATRSHQSTSAPSRLKPNYLAYIPSQNLTSQMRKCLQGVNCHLPHCFCKTTYPPRYTSPANTPQIIYIAIDSRIDRYTFPSLMQIFSGLRKNANACPISGTVFMPSFGNHALYVKVLQAKGVQIGVKGGDFAPLFSNSLTREKVTYELNRSHAFTNFTKSIGWRGFASLSPTDAVFQSLKDNGVNFDSSVMAESGEWSWPYTLDFGLLDRCAVMASRCPKYVYPGMWEVPMTPLRVLNDFHTCYFLDTCPGFAVTEEAVMSLLLNNFNLHYKGKKSPFGINLHSEWLVGRNKTAFQKGLLRFIDFVLSNRDVFVVNIEQMVKWVSSPTSELTNFPC